MPDQVYLWGGEHFCEPDTRTLHNFEGVQRILNPEIGYPKKVEGFPDPETFCSTCLKWFTDPAKLEGEQVLPPKGETA